MTNQTTPAAPASRHELACTRRAFLTHIQRENYCQPTGEPCREPERCGCHVEMENAIHAER